MDEAASVRELVEREKASHRGHGGHRGGFAVGGQNPLGNTVASRARISSKGKASHRGHRGHRGGFAVGGQNPLGNIVTSRASISSQGKHRTEVTEVTEGDFAVGGQNSLGNTGASRARISSTGESIAQRSRRPQRGICGRWPKSLSATPSRPGRELAPKGKHRTEVNRGGFAVGGQNPLGNTVTSRASINSQGIASHGGHRGGFAVGGQNPLGNTVTSRARISSQGESIAQRSQRPQRGFCGRWPKSSRQHRRVPGEKLAPRESIAQRSRRPQRGICGRWPKSSR